MNDLPFWKRPMFWTRITHLGLQTLATLVTAGVVHVPGAYAQVVSLAIQGVIGALYSDDERQHAQGVAAPASTAKADAQGSVPRA